jgi:hypothetical protein
MPIESDIMVFEDHEKEGEWRVDYFDGDGSCYVTIFLGPDAEQRARAYGDALKAGTLKRA